MIPLSMLTGHHWDHLRTFFCRINSSEIQFFAVALFRSSLIRGGDDAI